MIYSQNDRVFMRSLATQGRAGGLSPATERCSTAQALRSTRCLSDGVAGQEAMPL
jgi:hypothetical protein